MIPKVIHYCWFGRGPKPLLAKECIASWRKFLPDYEIKEWNEDNFDVNSIPYTAEAYAAKKYAFVSDYARFWILYNYGGIYFDTDVEVIKSVDDIVLNGPFMGLGDNPLEKEYGNDVHESCEGGLRINSGLGLAAERGLEIFNDVLTSYESVRFRNLDGSLNTYNVVERVTDLFWKRGLRPTPGIIEFAGLRIYPSDFFNPMGHNGRVLITENTRTIHHYMASWHTPRENFLLWVGRRFGRKAAMLIGLVTRNPLTIPSRIVRYVKNGR